MKKNILSMALAMAVSLGANAAPIYGSQAARIANMFINGRSAMYANTQLRMAGQSNEVQPYYVFNIGNNEGFVVVAGDDAVNPILAYSYEGSFNTDDMPDNVKSLMESYDRVISDIQQRKLPPKALLRKSGKTRETIQPMLKSKWNQNTPFNNDCPDFGKGRCYTGCVPTAMSQVMNYHKWPAYEINKIPGYTFTEYTKDGSGKKRTLDDLPATTFDWDGAAIEKIGNRRFDKAVAEISRYAGQATKALYGRQATGAFTGDMILGMIEHFDYSPAMMLLYHNDFKNEEEWRDIIYNELVEKRPVIFEGQPKKSGGHEFVCDGYENDKYHINWGWGGSCDGFFDLDFLNPNDAGIGGTNDNYSYYYGVVLNTEPGAHDLFVYAERMVVSPGSVVPLELKINCDDSNYTSVQFDLSLPEGITLVDDGNGKPKMTVNILGDHTVAYNQLHNGDYRFVISSPTNSGFKMKNRGLMSLEIAIDGDVVINSDVNIVTKNGIICNSMYRGFDFNNYYIALEEPTEELLGDINMNKVIDEKDLELLKTAVLKGKATNAQRMMADMNKDNVIDIADFMLLKDKIRRNNGLETFFEPTVNEGIILMSDIKNPVKEEDELAIIFPTLANAPAAKAVQFDVKIENGAWIKNIWSDPASRTQGHDFWCYYSYIGNNTYRIIVYENETRNIKDHFYAICGLGIDNIGDLKTEYSNVIVFTTDFRRITSDFHEYDPSGIDDVVVDNTVNDNGVYSLDGVKVGNNTDNLPKGVYIHNGKKIVVK